MEKSKNTGIGFFERYLTLWVALCMVVGVMIGKFLPGIPAFLGRFEYANVSNFFELAVAVAISLFGTKSPAALATTVGVLTEVPVMLMLVGIANQTKGWFK